MNLAIYTGLLAAALPMILCWFIWQVLWHRKYRQRFWERTGRVKPVSLRPQTPVFWVHAASVGEVLAAGPIIQELKRILPTARLYLTTNTDTGYAVAQEKIPFADQVFQTPFDLPWCIRAFLKRTHAAALIIMETEIWPNMISVTAKHRIPIILANGRISDRSLNRYRKFKWFIAPLLHAFERIIMQSEEDAEKIISIGASQDTVTVAGNVKYDRELSVVSGSRLAECLENLGWVDPAYVFVAGSTHKTEEDIICAAFIQVLAEIPDYRMILAPRHVNRTAEVCNTLDKMNLSYRLRSECFTDVPPGDGTVSILVLDGMGELATAYSLGNTAFVGGSLQNTGGHNVLEPAALSKPVLFGPYTGNFRDAVSQLLARCGGICVQNARELADTIITLHKNPEYARQMGNNAFQVVTDNRGAVQRHISLILESTGHPSTIDNQAFQKGNG